MSSDGCPSVCVVGVPIFSSYKNTHHTGIGPTLRNPLNLMAPFKGLISKHSHIWGPWGYGINIWIWGVHSAPHNIMPAHLDWLHFCLYRASHMELWNSTSGTSTWVWTLLLPHHSRFVFIPKFFLFYRFSHLVGPLTSWPFSHIHQGLWLLSLSGVNLTTTCAAHHPKSVSQFLRFPVART